MKFLVTGGAGFIGSALIRHILLNTPHHVLNVDCLTYAGNLDTLQTVSNSEHYQFKQIDIRNAQAMNTAFLEFEPHCIIHLAAESHVDRSIDGPAEFLSTNIIGTSVLLECARNYWQNLNSLEQQSFRFHHVSTDEVFGDLGSEGYFTETSAYAPSSPYSASKAASDHLVRAWHRTYGLPVVITNCSNNYGPYQFPEKLIPLVILNALSGKPLPVYGDGGQIRDWLYVEDHVKALLCVAQTGSIGETYTVGGSNEKTNLEVVRAICRLLDELVPLKNNELAEYADLITFVQDRPGHDQRYAVNASKLKNELGWQPLESFETGLRKTVQWYLENALWAEGIQNGEHTTIRLGGTLDNK